MPAGLAKKAKSPLVASSRSGGTGCGSGGSLGRAPLASGGGDEAPPSSQKPGEGRQASSPKSRRGASQGRHSDRAPRASACMQPRPAAPTGPLGARDGPAAALDGV